MQHNKNNKIFFGIKNSHKAFTLVELIVVIVILAILATIAFLSFSSQSASARDSTRLSDMNNIAKGLALFNTNAGSYPKPDSFVTILSSGTTAGFQGYVGSPVLNMIKISNGGKDPLDSGTYYTYLTNSALSKFEILGFLEDGNNSALSFTPFDSHKANADPISYSGRYAITKGDSLGVLLNGLTMLPIQAPGAISGTGVDVVSTTGSYVAIIDKTKTISGTGGQLNVVSTLIKTGYPKSCLELQQLRGKAVKDGTYTISPDGKKIFDAYCDMTTDGGGWTMWYTTSKYYHIAKSIVTSTPYGTDGYSRDLRKTPFKDIIYVRNSDNAKDWFKNSSGATIVLSDFILPDGITINVGGAQYGMWNGSGGANTTYQYQLIIGDNVWMQVGLMISGNQSSCYKATNNWCFDSSSNYYRIDGEGNGVNDLNAFHGVAFRQNGHVILPDQLMSVGIR